MFTINQSSTAKTPPLPLFLLTPDDRVPLLPGYVEPAHPAHEVPVGVVVAGDAAAEGGQRRRGAPVVPADAAPVADLCGCGRKVPDLC